MPKDPLEHYATKQQLRRMSFAKLEALRDASVNLMDLLIIEQTEPSLRDRLSVFTCAVVHEMDIRMNRRVGVGR